MITIIVTLALVGLTLAAWVVADIWLYHRIDPQTGKQGGYEATISYLTLTSSRARPIIAFGVGLLIGVLAGHLFWPQ